MRRMRIVVKIGSSSLTNKQGQLSSDKMACLVEQIASVQSTGEYQMILVSSGAVAAGLSKLGWPRSHITMPEKQAAAAVGQGLLIERYQKLFAEKGMGTAQLLLTRSDIEDRKRFIHIRNTAETLLRHGIIPIVNENDTVAVDEIRFGDNDTLGSLVALMTEANLLVLLTDIDGLYTANPKENVSARRIPQVWKITPEMEAAASDSGSPVGTGGMRTKLAAARMAVDSGIDVVIASSSEPNVLQKILEGKSVGTRFHSKQRLSGKKSWIAYGTRTEGTLMIDPGAVFALVKQTASLLLGGITKVEGDFHEGSVVEIAAPDGRRIGKGMVSFSAVDLRILLERRQRGEKFHNIHEVIHRDAMVILVREENLV
ncbi:glutamate 5-kinase [Lihuaxuella thermophila]|uniref:Glutamate 5-kinase n=1 Tax=Lihuaxuella thermophila TaxID=1173111 RepID=A0A1H8GEG8_9BACL|nr:glutamate 5-kinase [Lihuaxuella thermophila]SEN42180.1 glutamate 5-kinase [Lihuaxuella thermophila]